MEENRQSVRRLSSVQSETKVLSRYLLFRFTTSMPSATVLP